MKVLIVEDNPITALDLQDILELKGFKAKIANTFAEALEMFNSEQPDLALIDVNLNGQKDGIDLVNAFFSQDNIIIILNEKDASRAYDILHTDIIRTA